MGGGGVDVVPVFHSYKQLCPVIGREPGWDVANGSPGDSVPLGRDPSLQTQPSHLTEDMKETGRAPGLHSHGKNVLFSLESWQPWWAPGFLQLMELRLLEAMPMSQHLLVTVS